MPSPFPGMDPYIEACGLWDDFHGSLIHQISDRVAEGSSERYIVRSGRRTYTVLVDSEGKNSYPIFPPITDAQPVADGEPVTRRAFVEEEHRETFVEIYETDPEQRLVTCIEVLSPANKRPGTPGWDLYQHKRKSLLLGDVHLVEIDLLRGGQRMPMVDPWPKCPYVLMVAKAKTPQLCKVWQGHFQRPLPTIPIPLAKPDPVIPLNLQPMIEGIYKLYRYQQSINYTEPLTPPLNADEVAWLEEQVRAQAKPQRP